MDGGREIFLYEIYKNRQLQNYLNIDQIVIDIS